MLFDKRYSVIDANELDNFKIIPVPGAHHLSIKRNFDEQNLKKIVEKDQPLVIYCNSILCMGSSIASKRVCLGLIKCFYDRKV